MTIEIIRQGQIIHTLHCDKGNIHVPRVGEGVNYGEDEDSYHLYTVERVVSVMSTFTSEPRVQVYVK